MQKKTNQVNPDKEHSLKEVSNPFSLKFIIIG